MVLLVQQRENEARRRESELTELTENLNKRREAMETEMQKRYPALSHPPSVSYLTFPSPSSTEQTFANLAAEHAKKVQDEQVSSCPPFSYTAPDLDHPLSLPIPLSLCSLQIQHAWASRQRDMIEKEHVMELQITRHAEDMEREVNERFKKLQEEALAREKEREIERMTYRKEIEEKYEFAKRILEEDLSKAEQKLEKDLNTRSVDLSLLLIFLFFNYFYLLSQLCRYQQLSDKLQEKDKEREAEKQSLKRESERRYEAQVGALRVDLEAELSSRVQKVIIFT